MSYVVNGIAIIVCAGAGAYVAWWLAMSIGWEGVGGAIFASIAAMVVATALFALAVAIGKALRLIK